MPAKASDKLTRLALILALMFNATELLGVFLFTWATVVVIRGFAAALNPKDFYIATVILLMVGHKVLNLGRPPKSQNMTVPLSDDGCRADRVEGPSLSTLSTTTTVSQTFKKTAKFFAPGFKAKLANKFLSWYKLVQALICTGLSLWRLLKRDYGSDTANLHGALNIFYGLSLVHALPYLFKRFYAYWMIERKDLFKKMTKEYGLNPEDPEDVKFIKHYFYAIYLHCINEGIPDGLKMDIVSYTEQLSRDRNHPDRSRATRDLLPKFRRQPNKQKKRANKSMNTAMESIQETVV